MSQKKGHINHGDLRNSKLAKLVNSWNICCCQRSKFACSSWLRYTSNRKISFKKPTRCTLLLRIFISASLHVSGNYVPIISRTYSIYTTLVFFTLYGWQFVLQTRQPPIKKEKYFCRIDTLSFPNDGHIVARNM